VRGRRPRQRPPEHFIRGKILGWVLCRCSSGDDAFEITGGAADRGGSCATRRDDDVEPPRRAGHPARPDRVCRPPESGRAQQRSLRATGPVPHRNRRGPRRRLRRSAVRRDPVGRVRGSRDWRARHAGRDRHGPRVRDLPLDRPGRTLEASTACRALAPCLLCRVRQIRSRQRAPCRGFTSGVRAGAGCRATRPRSPAGGNFRVGCSLRRFARPCHLGRRLLWPRRTERRGCERRCEVQRGVVRGPPCADSEPRHGGDPATGHFSQMVAARSARRRAPRRDDDLVEYLSRAEKGTRAPEATRGRRRSSPNAGRGTRARVGRGRTSGRRGSGT
jgi:hypothetical protein